MAASFVLSVLLHVLVIGYIDAQYQAPRSDCTSPKGVPGLCIGIRQCPVLLNLLQSRPLRAESVEFLRQSQCAYDVKNPRVCCELTNSNVPVAPTGGQVNPGQTRPGQTYPGQSYPGQTYPGQSYPGQTSPEQTYPGQSYPGQTYPGQSYPGQTSPGQTYPGQSYPGQPYPGQSYPGQSYPGQSYPGQSYPGQSYPGQNNPGQSYPGQTNPGQSYPGQTNPGQTYPGQTYPGQTYPGQTYPDQPNQGIETPSSTGTTPMNDGVVHDLASNPLLPDDCGKDLSRRIIGGEQAELDEFPWMTLLEYKKPTGRSTACGGVLISRRYVLTAAHCVKGKDLPQTWRLESVRLGEYNTDTERDCIPDGVDTVVCADDPVSVGVEEVFAHEDYRPFARDQKNDIALLRLTRDVTFTDFIKPICLPRTSALGRKLYVAGWGKTENTSASNIKLKLSIPAADSEQCQNIYNNAGVTLGYGQICAGGQRGKDSCRGDSGGPLMSVGEGPNNNGQWIAVGVVSFGPSPCGMPGWPGVYTRVYDFVPWILSKMRP